MEKKKVQDEVVIHGFKGFDKNMQCRGFQFEEGKEYETDEAMACQSGFHACEYPLDVFCYYDPANSIYRTVEQSGKIDRHDGDTKVASTKIKIGATIDIKGLIKESFDYIKERCTNSKSGENYCALTGGDMSALTGGDMSALTGGDRSALTGDYRSALTGGYKSALTGGDRSALTGGYSSALTGGDMSALTGGYRSALTGGDRSALTGDYRSALTGGAYSVVYGCGKEAKVRGGIGSVLALVEFDDEYNLTKVKVRPVDGKKIKADTWYTLEDGKFVEVKDEDI
jgi:hypothetical protein